MCVCECVFFLFRKRVEVVKLSEKNNEVNIADS